MQRKVPFFILFSPFNSGLAAISSASLMPYSRLMLNTVSFRFTLCMSRHRDSTGPRILLLATTVLLCVSAGTMVWVSVVEGIRITCPIRKFSALSPGLASQMALADTLYFTVSR